MQELRAQIQAQLKLANTLRQMADQAGKVKKILYLYIIHIYYTLFYIIFFIFVKFSSSYICLE